MGNENWGAIPRSLATGVSTMLNKKLGVSSGFKPVEWEDNINLLGKLLEKTVSGAIASFSDGADDVPLKSCAVTIAPNLDGVSSVDVVKTGRNLLEIDSSYDIPARATTLTRDYSNNVLHIYGEIQDTNSNYYSQDITDLVREMGTITIIANTVSGGSADLSFRVNVQNGSTVISRLSIGDTSRTITYTEGYTYLLMFFVSISATVGNTVDMTVNFEADYGSSVGAYTPYVAPTTHTANLGRTIYGGSVDVVNGTGTETAGKAVFTGSETWQLYSNETFWYTTLQADNIKVQQSCTTSNGVVVRYQSTSGQLRVYISQNVGVVDTQTDMNALLSNGVSFAYPYETPETFTFTPTPINSFLGDNTIWCDSGDSEVVYRSSGTATIVPATLITKIITQNGTYSANSDNADGYSEVTVNTPVDTSIQIVYHNTTTGDTTFTATEAGKYLILVSYSDLGSGSITLPSGVTPDADFSKAHNRWGALIGKICDLSAGDTVTLNATSSSYGGIAYSKCVFRLKNISVTTVLASTNVEDGTLPSFAPTYTGNVLAIGASWGKNDAKCYDRTNPLGSGVEWASHVGLYTNLRITYGASIPAYVLYGYDGGALAIALQ